MYFCFTGPLRLIFCGGMAGVSLWIAVFPADVIKSRIQVRLYITNNFMSTLPVCSYKQF